MIFFHNSFCSCYTTKVGDMNLPINIIYRLSMRNYEFGARASGASKPKKMVQWLDLLGQPSSRNCVFKTFRPEPTRMA